jgi:translation initiation factor 2 subunit 3
MLDSSNQPEANIGLIGHVDHGKTTLTNALSGKWADTHSEEQKRGITIKLGYAECDIYADPDVNDASRYTVEDGDGLEHQRRISLVDAPGHESLMATMLAGTTVMDGAILLIAADERVPQAQTEEHLMALEIAGVENIIIAQNKIDLLTDDQLKQNHEQIKSFLKGTSYEDAPIIPISAEKQVNIDYLLEAVQDHLPTPDRDDNLPPRFLTTRSFDINRPGHRPDELVGGVLGGSLTQGTLSTGDTITIKPGRVVEEENQQVVKPITTTITSLNAGNVSLDEAKPGGSLGIMTELDPAIVKSDNLTGNLVGDEEALPPVWQRIKLDVNLLDRVVGSTGDKDVEDIKRGEVLLLNVNSATTAGQVYELGKDEVKVALRLPICADDGNRMSISRKVGNRFRLIGYGLLDADESEEARVDE